MTTESLCDKCFAPGTCCKRLRLSKGGDEVTFWDDEPEAVQTFLDGQKAPFEVIETLGPWPDEAGRLYSAKTFGCPKLLPNGRCGDYENRPEICRIFEPASDQLCVHFRGAEAGDPTLAL